MWVRVPPLMRRGEREDYREPQLVTVPLVSRSFRIQRRAWPVRLVGALVRSRVREPVSVRSAEAGCS
jgi:hypothetical protein